MSKDAIEEFGERLVQHCRDEAIGSGDMLAKPDRRGADADRLRAAAAAGGGLLPADTVIPECVDSAVASLLWAIDDSLIRLSFTTEHGETVFLPEDGYSEMCGWYGGTGGWRTWYSRERILDAEDPVFRDGEWCVDDSPDDPAPIREELPMPERAVNEFAELLVRHVRDVAIQSCDLQLLPHSETPVAKRWRRAAVPFDGKVPPQVVIPDCVDETIFAFLRAIDQGLLRLSFTAESGEVVDLAKEGRGELAARYISSGGWRAKYSKERFFDDFADRSSG
jgi:hypothetical protein